MACMGTCPGKRRGPIWWEAAWAGWPPGCLAAGFPRACYTGFWEYSFCGEGFGHFSRVCTRLHFGGDRPGFPVRPGGGGRFPADFVAHRCAVHGAADGSGGEPPVLSPGGHRRLPVSQPPGAVAVAGGAASHDCRVLYGRAVRLGGHSSGHRALRKLFGGLLLATGLWELFGSHRQRKDR